MLGALSPLAIPIWLLVWGCLLSLAPVPHLDCRHRAWYPTWSQQGDTGNLWFTTTVAFSLISSASLVQEPHPRSCRGGLVTHVHSSFASSNTGEAQLFCPHAAWCEQSRA